MADSLRDLQPKHVTPPPDLKDNPERLRRFQSEIQIQRPKSDSGDDFSVFVQPPPQDPIERERAAYNLRQQTAQYQYTLNNWLNDVADQLNTQPPFSTFSWSNPNSNQSAIPGTIGFNLNSANTAKIWGK